MQYLFSISMKYISGFTENFTFLPVSSRPLDRSLDLYSTIKCWSPKKQTQNKPAIFSVADFGRQVTYWRLLMESRTLPAYITVVMATRKTPGISNEAWWNMGPIYHLGFDVNNFISFIIFSASTEFTSRWNFNRIIAYKRLNFPLIWPNYLPGFDAFKKKGSETYPY